MFHSIIDRHASVPLPLCVPCQGKKIDEPWITRGILTSIKSKSKLFKKYFKNKNFDTDKSKKEHYKKYLNKLAQVKNLAKCIYYENLIKCNNNNPFQTWSIIKEIIDYKNSTKKTVLPSAITIEDESVRTDTFKFAESLCKFFTNIGTKMFPNLTFSDAFFFKIHSKSCLHSFMLYEITLEVSNSISNIKPYFASGMNGILLKFIKLTRCILFPYLAKLFNKCIEQEIFPRDFKAAYVIKSYKLRLQNLLMNFVPFLYSPFCLNCVGKF